MSSMSKAACRLKKRVHGFELIRTVGLLHLKPFELGEVPRLGRDSQGLDTVPA